MPHRISFDDQHKKMRNLPLQHCKTFIFTCPTVFDNSNQSFVHLFIEKPEVDKNEENRSCFNKCRSF